VWRGVRFQHFFGWGNWEEERQKSGDYKGMWVASQGEHVFVSNKIFIYIYTFMSEIELRDAKR